MDVVKEIESFEIFENSNYHRILDIEIVLRTVVIVFCDGNKKNEI